MLRPLGASRRYRRGDLTPARSPPRPRLPCVPADHPAAGRRVRAAARRNHLRRWADALALQLHRLVCMLWRAVHRRQRAVSHGVRCPASRCTDSGHLGGRHVDSAGQLVRWRVDTSQFFCGRSSPAVLDDGLRAAAWRGRWAPGAQQRLLRAARPAGPVRDTLAAQQRAARTPQRDAHFYGLGAPLTRTRAV